MPARKNPVKNLKMRSDVSPSANKYIFRLAKAARIEQIKKTFLGEKRSEIAKKAKHRVPAINPN